MDQRDDQPDHSDRTSRTYQVTGMTCAHCAGAVTEEVSALDGVTGVDVEVGSGTVVVHGSGVSDEGVRAAVEEAGYAVV